MEPLLRPPVGFAHRGARAHAAENSLDAFRLALKLGATGLSSEVWVTADGVPVLSREGGVKAGLRRQPFATLARARLPPAVATLEDLYGACGTDFELSLQVMDPAAAPAAAAVARAAGAGAARRLWLGHGDLEQLARWRALGDDLRLVEVSRIRRMKGGPERRAADLAAAGVDAVSLHHSDWTLGLATLFHRFERLCLASDAQFERILAAVLEMGVDGVYSDHVDRMTDALKLASR